MEKDPSASCDSVQGEQLCETESQERKSTEEEASGAKKKSGREEKRSKPAESNRTATEKKIKGKRVGEVQSQEPSVERGCLAWVEPPSGSQEHSSQTKPERQNSQRSRRGRPEQATKQAQTDREKRRVGSKSKKKTVREQKRRLELLMKTLNREEEPSHAKGAVGGGVKVG